MGKHVADGESDLRFFYKFGSEELWPLDGRVWDSWYSVVDSLGGVVAWVDDQYLAASVVELLNEFSVEPMTAARAQQVAREEGMERGETVTWDPKPASAAMPFSPVDQMPWDVKPSWLRGRPRPLQHGGDVPQ